MGMAKFSVIGAALSLAAVASALVLPESAAVQQPLHGSYAPGSSPITVDTTAPGDGSSRWLKDSILEKAKFGFHEIHDESQHGPAHDRGAVDSIFHAVQEARGRIHEDISKTFAGFTHGLADRPTGYETSQHSRDHDDYTIYDLISKSKHTTRFAKIVDKHPDIVKLLSSTSANHTLFVPVDEAFEGIPEDHKDPGKEFVEKLLLYHIGLGEYPAGKIIHSYTIPTAYDEKWLGDEPQRLRASVGLGGVKLNFYSKVVAADIKAKNGIVHGVNHILVPPPFLGKILSLFPSHFSTLLLAYEKTDFVKFIHGVKLAGSTVFAPTNEAFAYLGPRANAFLFNTEKGHKYLTALLKYQIVPNATLYTDAFYDKRDNGDDETDIGDFSTEHYDLPTLLGKAHIGVDIARVFGFATIKVNGFTRVVVPDGIGANGVIQVVNRVPIPPHKKRGHSIEDIGDIEVEDLMERLEQFL